MATAVSVESGLASVQSSAANALASALSGGDSGPAPAPAPASSPSSDPAAPASPAPPGDAASAAAPTPEATPAAAPQAPPAGQAPAPITIDTNGLSPEARRFLEMKGGDVDRALRDALDYNNRLAAAARPGAPTAPAPGAVAPPQAPGTTPATAAAPPTTPTATTPQAPPAQPTVAAVAPTDPMAFEAEVDRLLGTDQECLRLAQEFRADVDRVQALQAQYKDIDGEIRYHERRLQDGDVKDDEVAQSAIKEQIRELKEARAELRETTRHAREVETAYNTRAAGYEQRINAREQARRQQAESDANMERHAQTLSATWQPGIQRAASDNKIPAALTPKFEASARKAALANLELGFGVEDLPAFLQAQAKEFLEVIVEGHREMSAQAGDMARQRADQPSPAPVSPVATAPVHASDDLKDVYKAARARLEGRA